MIIDVHMIRMLIGRAINPQPMLLLLGFVGFILLLAGKRLGLAKTLVGISVLGLYAISTGYVAQAIISPLEFKYPAYQQHRDNPNGHLAYIVVLGCSHSRSKHLPSSSYLFGCAQIRLHEALRLYQLNPGAKVIFTGKGGVKNATIADSMALFAKEVGIKAQDIMIEPRAANTSEEAAYVSPVVVDAPTALVTSAVHMPRAMMLFEQQGIDMIPAPTDYLIHMKLRKPHMLYFIPTTDNQQKVERAFHEYYGFLWAYLQDWFEDWSEDWL